MNKSGTRFALSSIARWIARIALACGPLLLASCATLPDYHALRRSAADPSTPVVIGARGELPARQSAAVLKRLQSAGDRNLLEHHLAFVQTLNDTPLTVGNATRLLIDGPAAHAAMFKAIAAARDHINLQTFIFESDAVGQKLAELLLRKRSQGVEVNVLYDSVGSMNTPSTFFDALRAGGIRVCEFNPINPLKGKSLALNHRDHRKLLVVDGALAYTGGINISAVYTSGSAARRHKPSLEDGWRDTQVEIAGAAVGEFQKLFIASWEKQKCPALAERAYFPPPRVAGDRIVRVIGSSPGDPLNLIYLEMLSAISHARLSVYLTMAYFVPDPQMLAALKEAAGRGVDVHLVLAGVSDFWVVLYAGRSHYADLLAAGVKISERKDAMLHAKTAVIDGVWSTVG